MSRRALITGVSGFAGRHLAVRLVAAGWQVSGTTRSRSAGLPDVAEHRVDICDVAGLEGVVASVHPTHVFHLAGIVDTVTTPDVMELYRTNVLGTAAILEALGSAEDLERVLVTSSAFAYGRPPADGRPVREDDAQLPVTPYGASKVGCEAIALQWARSTGKDVIVTRAFQHTGPWHVGAYALSDWAAQLAGGATTIRVGNLDVARDYLDVRDVATAYEALMGTGRPGTVYNVGSGVPVTMRAMLEGLVAAFGGTAEILVEPSRLRAADVSVFVADVGRLRADTDWRPQFSLEQTLRDLASWWKGRLP